MLCDDFLDNSQLVKGNYCRPTKSEKFFVEIYYFTFIHVCDVYMLCMHAYMCVPCMCGYTAGQKYQITLS